MTTETHTSLPGEWVREVPGFPENRAERFLVVGEPVEGTYRITSEALAMLLSQCGYRPAGDT